MSDLDALLATADRHRQRTTDPFTANCDQCSDSWPCLPARLAAAVRDLRQAHDTAHDTALAVIQRLYDGWTILDGEWCLPNPAATRLALSDAEAAVLDQTRPTP